VTRLGKIERRARLGSPKVASLWPRKLGARGTAFNRTELTRVIFAETVDSDSR
jgi:hypothetical protein